MLDPALYLGGAVPTLVLALRTVWRCPTCQLNLRGPASPSFLFGNMLQLQASYECGEYNFRCLEEYGMVYPHSRLLRRTRLLPGHPYANIVLSQQRLIVGLTQARSAILNNPAIFGWAATQQKAAKLFFGWDSNSVTLARGERHKY